MGLPGGPLSRSVFPRSPVLGMVFSPLLRNFPSGEGAASPARMGVPSQGLVEFRLGPQRVPPRVLSLRRWIVGAVVLEAVRWRAVWGLSVLMAFVSGTVRLKNAKVAKEILTRVAGRVFRKTFLELQR